MNPIFIRLTYSGEYEDLFIEQAELSSRVVWERDPGEHFGNRQLLLLSSKLMEFPGSIQ